MHSSKKYMSYLVVGVAYIHKELPPVLGRMHIYELQLETAGPVQDFLNSQ